MTIINATTLPSTKRPLNAPPCAVRVTVVIVNYNGRSYLGPCLQALRVAGHSGVEIVLVDNGSSDGSVDYVATHFPRVKIIRNAENAGFGGANNVGAQVAQGEYLAFLNPDTAVTPHWLEALLGALEEDPQAALATPKILLMATPQRINTGGNDIHLTGLTLCRGMGLPKEALAETAVVSAVSGAAFVMRRDLFLELGGFDSDFFMYMEDTDLSWRAQLTGYRCLYVPQSVVYHDYTLRFGPQKTYYQERNRYLMLLKGLRWRTLALLLPALLLAEMVTWGFVLLQDRAQWANKVRAYGYLWRYRHALLAARRQVQAQRRTNDRTLLQRCTHRLAYDQTGSSLAARLAHFVFDPLFFIWQRLLLALVRW